MLIRKILCAAALGAFAFAAQAADSVTSKTATQKWTDNRIKDATNEMARTMRAKSDLRVKVEGVEPTNEHWTWTAQDGWRCPDDFLEKANSFSAPKPRYYLTNDTTGVWGGVVFRRPDGSPLYVCDLKEGTSAATNLRFRLTRRLEDGETKDLVFFALAHRESATDVTPVPIDKYDTLATLDNTETKVGNWEIDRRSKAIAQRFAELDAKKLDANAAPKGALRLLPPYLHYMEVADSYYSNAVRFCESHLGFAPQIGACSSFRNGDDYGRNYDWLYDHSSEFVVGVLPGADHFGSVGVSSLMTNLNEDAVISGEWSERFKCVPGFILDGINEKGLLVSMNVVPTNGSPWEVKAEGQDLCGILIPRFCVDRFRTAREAVEYITDRIYIPASLLKLGDSLHFMVSDPNETYIIEDGVAELCDDSLVPVMTNFRRLRDDPYGTGYARFAIITNDLKRGVSPQRTLMDVWFTEGYRRPFTRLDEFAGIDDGNGPVRWDETERLYALAEAIVPQGAPETLTRNGKAWQTLHSSVYDFRSRTLRVACQEKDDWYVFRIPGDRSETVGKAALKAALDALDPDTATAKDVIDALNGALAD